MREPVQGTAITLVLLEDELPVSSAPSMRPADSPGAPMRSSSHGGGSLTRGPEPLIMPDANEKTRRSVEALTTPRLIEVDRRPLTHPADLEPTISYKTIDHGHGVAASSLSQKLCIEFSIGAIPFRVNHL